MPFSLPPEGHQLLYASDSAVAAAPEGAGSRRYVTVLRARPAEFGSQSHNNMPPLVSMRSTIMLRSWQNFLSTQGLTPGDWGLVCVSVCVSLLSASFKVSIQRSWRFLLGELLWDKQRCVHHSHTSCATLFELAMALLEHNVTCYKALSSQYRPAKLLRQPPGRFSAFTKLSLCWIDPGGCIV